MMPRQLAILILIISGFSTLAAAPLFRSGSVLKESREALAIYDYSKAITLADSVLSRSNNDLSKLEALEIKAKAYAGMGKISAADQLYSRVAEESGKLLGEGSKGHLNSLFNHAQFLMLTGRYEESLQLTDSIPTGADSDLNIDVWGLRASVLMWLNRETEALDMVNRAIAMQQDSGTNEGTKAVLIQNRGFLHSRMKDYAEAIKDYTQAVEMLQGKNKGAALANLALAQANTGLYSDALGNIDEALQLLIPYGTSDEDYLIALRKKGEILNLSGREKEAAVVMEQFFRLERDRLTEILPGLSPQTRLNYWTKEKPLLSKIFLTAETSPALSFDAALLRRQTSLMGNRNVENTLAKLQETHNDILRRLHPGEAAVAFVLYEDAGNREQNAAITLDYKGNMAFVPLFPQDSIYRKNQTGQSIYELVTSGDPSAKSRLYTDTLLGNALWQPILEQLPANVTTLHFAPEGIFHLWSIENMPYKGKEKVTAVRHFALNDINSGKPTVSPTSSKLIAGGFDYDRLWGVPAGEVGPAEAPSSSSVGVNGSEEGAAEKKEAYNEILRSAAINEGDRIFQYLPGTLKETGRIILFHPGAELRTDLTEEEFKTAHKGREIIHLATHGYTLSSDIDLSRRPETDSLGYDMTLWKSGLALEGANVNAQTPWREDGILAAREICDLDLSDTSIIILSACQTALGEISDESASGLIRALKNAGANTIVASLWEVDDESTALFMSAFHEALAGGATKTEAFRKAQSATRELSRSVAHRKFHAGAMAGKPTGTEHEVHPYSSPWYWAPFVLIDP